MSDDRDIFTEHYRLLQTDRQLRQRLLDDPVAGMREYYGQVPDGGYKLEVISQESDKITLVLPSRPEDGKPSDAAIDAASRRVYDMLFTDGIGGYLIPDTQLMWVLRDMRAVAAKKDDTDGSPASS